MKSPLQKDFHMRYDHEPALCFARAMHAKYATSLPWGDSSLAEFVSKKWPGDSATLEVVNKAAVPGESTGSLGGAGLGAAIRGFLQLVRAKSLIGQISGWNWTIPHVDFLTETPLLEATWGNLPVAHVDLSKRAMLDRKHIGCILPVTKSLIELGGAVFESNLTNSLVGAVAAGESASLIDENNSGNGGKSPAGITHGLTPVPGTGDAKADIQSLLDGFDGDVSRSVLVSSPRAGIALYGAGFLETGAQGGAVAGLKHVTNTGVDDDHVALIDPGAVAMIDDGIEITTSENGIVSLGTDSNDDPVLASVFQAELVGIKAVRYLNWQRLRDNSVAFIAASGWVNPLGS